jgi:type III secretion system SsaH family protein
MSMRLDAETRRVLVEAGLAAVNNGLYPQAEAIRHALPQLTENDQARNIINAVMLIGLCDPQAAVRTLQGDCSEAAMLLRKLMQPAKARENAWLSRC